MKIAIPSNNLINIADDFVHAKNIVLFLTDQNKIVDEECIEIDFEDDANKIASFFNKISVCAIISKNTNKELEVALSDNQIELFITDESLITNAITDFIKDQNLKESNYCCCP